MNEYEWEFMQDSRDKKRTARGASARASRKRGFKGTMKTPIDNLKGKARKIYMNETTTTTIMSFLEFKDLELHQRAKVLANLLQKYSRAKLCSEWSISPGTLSGIIYRMKKVAPELVDKLGGPINPTGPTKASPVVSTPLDTVLARNFAFSLSVSGDFDGDDLSGRLLNIANLLETDKKYHVSFRLVELED